MESMYIITKSLNKKQKGKVNLSEEEKRYFDNYHLDVLTYIDVTEKESS